MPCIRLGTKMGMLFKMGIGDNRNAEKEAFADKWQPAIDGCE